MDALTAIEKRHSVRRYIDREIDNKILAELKAEIDECNKEGGLHIQLITNEPEAFGNIIVHYGRFKGVRNYIALVGRKDASLDEKSGYYGERIVLKAQMLGLNTCWVAVSFNKKAARKAVNIEQGEKHANEGKSIIFISSEMPEILGMCDRIYIMNEGRIVGDLSREEASAESIMKCIMQSNREVV